MPSPNAATLSASVNVGTPLRCKGYIPVDPNWFGFLVSTSNRGKVMAYTLKHVPLPTLVFAQFCLGAPYEFTTLFLKPAPQGTLPDGEPGFIGLLPPCRGGEPPGVARIPTRRSLVRAWRRAP